MAPTTIVRPTPMRRDTAGASSAPSRPPTAPTPKASPISPDARSRVRLANSTSKAPDMNVKKLTVVAQPRLARSTGWWSTKRSPSLARCSTDIVVLTGVVGRLAP